MKVNKERYCSLREGEREREKTKMAMSKHTQKMND